MLLTRRGFEIIKLAAEGHTKGMIASMPTVTKQTITFPGRSCTGCCR